MKFTDPQDFWTCKRYEKGKKMTPKKTWVLRASNMKKRLEQKY
jgi:hypothetical protein